MKDIDFLPDEFKEARRKHDMRMTRLWLGLIGLTALVLLFASGQMQVNDARAELDYLKHQNEIVLDGLNLISGLKLEQARLAERFKLLEQLGPETDTVETLAKLAEVMPAQIVLKECRLRCEMVQASSSKTSSGLAAVGKVVSAADASKDKSTPQVSEKVRVEILGLAATEMDVAIFVGRLSSYQKFRDVQLDYCRVDSIEDRQANSFRISFLIDSDQWSNGAVKEIKS